jgi:hypothetical protein
MQVEIVDKNALSLKNIAGRGKWVEIREKMAALPEGQAILLTPNGEGVAKLRARASVALSGNGFSVRLTTDGKVAVVRK